jgi:hypothetical protein
MNARTHLKLGASFLLAGALLAACGSSVNTMSTGTGTGGASSSAGTGGAGMGGGTTGVSTSDGGSAPACSTFDPPQPMSTPVSVRLVNKSGSPMYLGQTTAGCASAFGFTLADASTSPLKPSRGDCEYTCGELQQMSCVCADGCGAPVVTLVAPDAYYEVPWTGTVFTTEDMPAKCFKDASCAASDTSCLVEESAPAGTLTMKASAYSQALGCNPNPCMPCMPGALGTCTVLGAMTVGGTELKGTAAWMGESKIDIDIQ